MENASKESIEDYTIKDEIAERGIIPSSLEAAIEKMYLIYGDERTEIAGNELIITNEGSSVAEVDIIITRF